MRFVGWMRMAGFAAVLCAPAGAWAQAASAGDAKAAADDGADSPPAAASDSTAARKPDPLAPSSLLSGPSIYETGRIGGMAPAASDATVPSPLEPARASEVDREKSIAPAAAQLGAPLPVRRGTIDPVVLAREIDEHLATIEDCRIDVARERQVTLAQITANTLLLRWTIEPSGRVANTDVVATTPVDLSVMDCAKATMSQWTFTRPRGGPVQVERGLVFRPLRLSAAEQANPPAGAEPNQP